MATLNTKRKLLLSINIQTPPHARRHNLNLNPHFAFSSRRLRSCQQLRGSHRPSRPPAHRGNEPQLFRKTAFLNISSPFQGSSSQSQRKLDNDTALLPHPLYLYRRHRSHRRTSFTQNRCGAEVARFRSRRRTSYILLLHPSPRYQWAHRSFRLIRSYRV